MPEAPPHEPWSERRFLFGYLVVTAIAFGSTAVFGATGQFATQHLAIVFVVSSAVGLATVLWASRVFARARRDRD
jgi:hypothetical protein